MTQTQTPVRLPVCSRREADEGASYADGTSAYWRLLLVEEDGTVRAWDDLAEYYSLHHDLTPSQEHEARRLAGLTA